MGKINNTYSIITMDDSEKLTVNQLSDVVTNFLASEELRRLKMYGKYYESVNPEITGKYIDRRYRGKTPNNYIPTGYYSTLVDTVVGYMFSNVQYVSKNTSDNGYVELLNDILESNNTDIKDMKTGIYCLAYNKGVELVYTTGDGINTPEIKYTTLDPREVILIYNDEIEPEVFCGVRVCISSNKDYDYKIDVFYKDQWQKYWMIKGELKEREDFKELFFDECPIIIYRSEMMNCNSVFQKVIPYIDALDYLVSGNSNEIERLVDAILVIGKVLKAEDKINMDEWKTLEDMSTEDRAEYLTKDMSPEFRQYVSKLLISEIHKHSHVVDWYGSDETQGTLSARAMITRIFDMDMFSNRVEKIYKEGTQKRIRLINKLIETINKGKVGEVNIIFKRTIPDDFIDKAPVLNQLQFVSDETKLDLLGFDSQDELEKLKKQKEENAERFEMNLGENNTNDNNNIQQVNEEGSEEASV